MRRRPGRATVHGPHTVTRRGLLTQPRAPDAPDASPAALPPDPALPGRSWAGTLPNGWSDDAWGFHASCGSSEDFSAKLSSIFPREVTRTVSAGSLSRGSAIPNRADARSGPFLGDFAGPPLARRPASATCTAARLRASRRCARARPSPSNWLAGQGAGLGSSPLLGGGARRI